MEPALPSEEEAKLVVEETIKRSTLYSENDFIEVDVLSGEDFYEVGVLYSPARASKKVVTNFDEFQREQEANPPNIAYFSLELHLKGEGYTKRGTAELFIGVPEDFQGKGNCKTLVQIAEDISRNLGLDRIQSMFRVDYEERSFLEKQKLGYSFDDDRYAYKEF